MTMKKWVKIIGNIFISTLVLLLFALAGVFGWVMYERQIIPLYGVVVIFFVYVVPTLLFIYILYRTNRYNSDADYRRERDVLKDLSNIRHRRSVQTKSKIGYLYSVAISIAIFFPVISNVLGRFIEDVDLITEILLGLGYVMILMFIFGSIYQDRKNRH